MKKRCEAKLPGPTYYGSIKKREKEGFQCRNNAVGIDAQTGRNVCKCHALVLMSGKKIEYVERKEDI